MEESGHYYTVYFTSLAVGFDEDIAFRHASLAQMPDEVMALDAATMHTAQAFNVYVPDLFARMKIPTSEWRYLIEHVIHALPDKDTGNLSSGYQRSLTRNLLSQNSADSIEFGLLLHRLGDTYAHSQEGHEDTMYSTGMVNVIGPGYMGHGLAGHSPDHPRERPWLYFQYLEDLYNVLHKKVQEWDSVAYRRSGTSMSLPQLIQVFQFLLEDSQLSILDSFKRQLLKHGDLMRFARENYGYKTDALSKFISGIRAESYKRFNIQMDFYSPEDNGGQTLTDFLRDHGDFAKRGVTAQSVINALKELDWKMSK